MFFLNFRQKFSVVLALLTFLFYMSAQADVTDQTKKNNDNSLIRSAIRSSRGYSRFSKPAQEQGKIRFFRSTILDGNLVTGAITNNGMLSHADMSIPPLSWPKGPKMVDYIFGSYFYVAAQVVDANGDSIAIVSDYYRFGEEAPDQSHGYHFMPLPKYFNLDEPDALSTPLVYGISEDVGEDGIPNTNDPGEGDGQLQPIEDFNDNGELDLSLQNTVGWFATSSRPETWPTWWPVGSYPGDDRQEGQEIPGNRAGRWNGEFGAYVRGDQESYYVMDDSENDEFEYYPFPGDTLSWPNGRRGLGVTIEARTYQWNARLAEDILINVYDITNNGKPLTKSVVGMLVDPDMGGQANNDDANFNTIDDITYTWNLGGREVDTGLPIGYFGFAFLESPGLAGDTVDNDQDGMVNESQYNGIDDDGDWTPWEDVNGNGVYDNEDTNHNLLLDDGEDVNGNNVLDIEPIHDDVGSDGLGPNDFEYNGPDAGELNGVPDLGEPNFETTDNDESDQVGLTSAYFKPHSGWMDDDQTYWDEQLQPGTFHKTSDWQTDVAFTYGSGFIKFALDTLDNGNIVDERTQRYAIALAFGNDYSDIIRNKRTIQVIYDNDYNFAKAPLKPTVEATAGNKTVYLEWDNIAERSTDPIYGQDFEAYYVYRSTDPTFEEIKTITDAYGNPLLFKPIAIFDKINGLKGLHPVRLGSELGSGSDLGVTYNMGDDSGLQHFYIDENVINGMSYYYAVASLDQGYYPTFYDDSISTKRDLNPIAPTESPVNIQIDPLGRPISYDRNTVQVIPTEESAGWVYPNLGEQGLEHVSGRGTGSVEVLVHNPHKIKTGHSYRIEFSDDGSFENYDTLAYTGYMNNMKVISLTDNEVLLDQDNPLNSDYNEKYILENAFRVVLHNDSNRVALSKTGWIVGDPTLNVANISQGNSWYKRDFEIRILGPGADTTRNNIPVNYQVWDVTNPDSTFKMVTALFDRSEAGRLDTDDKLVVYNNYIPRRTLLNLVFQNPADIDTADWRMPQNGDIFAITTHKGFDRYDAYEFTFNGNEITKQKTKEDLDNVYVVPDPYIAVNRLERKVLNPEEGRGERRIDFVNLPQNCTVTIFTASGKMVQKLTHSATEKDRRLSWNMRTKDGLEIASGVYFYAVEAPGIGSTTGKFAVIK